MLSWSRALSRLVARIKYRFDLGQSFMSVINFGFIVIAASDKLSTVTHLSATVMIAVLVPASVVSVWFFGFVLDAMKFPQAYTEESNRRNEMISDMHQKLSKDADTASNG